MAAWSNCDEAGPYPTGGIFQVPAIGARDGITYALMGDWNSTGDDSSRTQDFAVNPTTGSVRSTPLRPSLKGLALLH